MRGAWGVWTVCMLVGVLAATAWGQDATKKPDVWPMIDEAAALIKTGKLDKAEEAAAMFIQTDASHPMGYALMISIIEKKKDYGPAVIALCDALMKAQSVDETVKKPDPLRRHQLWHCYANRHKGEALMRQKKYAEAAACFQTAGDMAFQAARPMDARQTRRWQIEMANRRADALWEAGKREEAVTARQQIIQRHDKDPRGCNNCVRVKGDLIANLVFMGRRNDAKRILETALADARLDAFQKEWVEAIAANAQTEEEERAEEARAREQGAIDLGDGILFELEPDDVVLATSMTADAFVIRAEHRFELRVNLADGDRYGMITQWYDLQNDPLRQVDLQDDNWFSMLKPHHLHQEELVDGRWKNIDYNRYVQLRKEGKLGVGFNKEQNEFKVFEKSPARVRFGYTNRSWPAEKVVYTVYPDGRIYAGFHWNLVNPDKTIRIRGMGYYTGVSGIVNWRTTIGEKTGMFGSPYIQGAAPFTMMHSNEDYPCALTSTRADIATCLARPSGSYGNNTLFLAWFRTPVQAKYDPEKQAEVDEAVFMHIWPNDRNSYEAELHYVLDYQSPAKLEVTKGTVVTDDPGDYNKDGFNEAEGCYVLKADGNEVALTIDGSKVRRFNPVFKVTGLPEWARIVTVGRDEERLEQGKSVSTHLDSRQKTAIVRLIGTVSAKSTLEMRFLPDEREP